MSYVRKRS